MFFQFQSGGIGHCSNEHATWLYRPESKRQQDRTKTDSTKDKLAGPRVYISRFGRARHMKDAATGGRWQDNASQRTSTLLYSGQCELENLVPQGSESMTSTLLFVYAGALDRNITGFALFFALNDVALCD